MINRNLIYHPKLLNLFTQAELNLLIQDSIYSLDKSDRVDVIVSLNTKIDVEIYIDCKAENSDIALISLLDDKGYSYPKVITKEIFLKVFNESEVVKTTCLTVEE